MTEQQKIEHLMKPDEEVWVKVNGYEHYEVSNRGRVRKISYLTTYSHTKGLYPQIQLFKGDNHGKRKKKATDEKAKKMFLHRLLAEHFIPNPDNKPMVNHKDGNKLNFALDNLEWVTASENLKHAYSTGLTRGGKNQQTRVVIQVENESVVKIWKGCRELRENAHTWNKIYDSIRRGVFYKRHKWHYINYMYDYKSDTFFKKESQKKVIVSLDEVELAAIEYLTYQASQKEADKTE